MLIDTSIIIGKYGKFVKKNLTIVLTNGHIIQHNNKHFKPKLIKIKVTNQNF